MTIFAKPDSDYDNATVKVLFLHGLEGSPTGEKSVHLEAMWQAKSPPIRANKLRELKGKLGAKNFQSAPKKALAKAMAPAYEDVCDAVRFMEPDIIVGSSMGGGLLAKMVMEGVWDGHCVFLAPAIENLLGDVALPPMKSSVWVLAEFDDQVANGPNIRHCLSVGGSLMVSPDDTHRLQKALKKGLIDAAIVTTLELASNT